MVKSSVLKKKKYLRGFATGKRDRLLVTTADALLSTLASREYVYMIKLMDVSYTCELTLLTRPACKKTKKQKKKNNNNNKSIGYV